MDDNRIFVIALLGLVVLVILFLILREFVCWYWKINERISIGKENNKLLKDLIDTLNTSNPNLPKNTKIFNNALPNIEIEATVKKHFVSNFGNKKFRLTDWNDQTSNYLKSENSTLKYMIEKFERYNKETKCDLLPIYIALELDKREEVFDQKIWNDLNRYSQKMGFVDFNEQMKDYEI